MDPLSSGPRLDFAASRSGRDASREAASHLGLPDNGDISESEKF